MTHEFTCCMCDDVFIESGSGENPNNRTESFQMLDLSGSSYCEDCYWEYHESCTECDDVFSRDELQYSEYSDSRICDDCISDYYYFCDDCNDYIPQNESCGCGSRRINDYNYQPVYKTFSVHGKGNWIQKEMQKVNAYPDRLKIGNLTLGFELEVENINEEPCGDDAEWGTGYGDDFLYCKRDGSLNYGFEIVSMPFTIDFYKQILYRSNYMRRLLHNLKRENYRSYNTSTCGMHVHMNLRAFRNIHLYKYQLFFSRNYNFISWMSKRKSERLDEWANPQVSEQNCLGRTRNKQSPKYTAVHITPKKTVEVRIFRGTLDHKAFCRNIEFCLAVYEFSRLHTIKQMSQIKFIQWFKSHNEYPMLRQHLIDKWPGWSVKLEPYSNKDN